MDEDMSGLNGFERSVKEALEPYEVPYNSADWSQLERALDGRSDSARVSRSGLVALLFGGAVAAFSSLFVLIAPDRLSVGEGHRSAAQPTLAQTVNLGSDQPSGTDIKGTVPVGIDVEASQVEVVEPRSGKAPKADLEVKGIKPQSYAVSGAEIAPPEHPMSNEPLVKPSVTEGCPGTVIDFEAENLSNDGMYLWNFGDGSFSNKPKPNHAFAKSGSFEVMLSHSTPGGGNIRNKAAADRIVIHEAPEASFNVLKQEYENTVPSVHFENRSLGGRSYYWDFGDGTTSTVAHPDHVYKKAGVYTVSLTVTNAKGCEDHSERNVRIDTDYDLLAPKTFSPNGDGVDDVFIPEALKTLGVKFNFSVFESGTGVLVYETTDPQRPWNGRLNNRGELSAPGDYVWMVEMKDGDKLGGSYNGSLQLVR